MKLDGQAKFSTAQLITASAISANTIDKLAKGEAYSKPLFLYVRAAATLDSATHAATLQVKIQTADAIDVNNALTGTVYDLDVSPVQPVANLVANMEIWKVRLPRGTRRYMALSYVVAGGENFTQGSVDAFITDDIESVGQLLRPGPGIA